MSSQQKSPFSCTAGEDLAIFRLTKNVGGTAKLNTATATDVPMGVTQAACDSGAKACLADIKRGGTHKVTAAGAIAAGAPIYAAADGKVQALPAVAGTYRRVGQNCAGAATADGDVIQVYLTPDGDTDTVAGS